MVAKESEEMAEAAEKLLQISADERAQAYAFSRDNSEFARKLHEQGIREEGIEEGLVTSIINLMNNLKLSIEDAMIALGIPEAEHNNYVSIIQGIVK